jgi:hypothetical protein
LSLAGAIMLAASFLCAQAQTLAGGAVKRIGETQVVTLEGNVHPLARAEFDEGAVDADLRLERMLFVLKSSPEKQRALDELVEEQQNPASPLYHQWLTPAEFGAQFGANEAGLAQVGAWLAAHGFAIDEIAAGRRIVAFSGTVGQVYDAFHTEMHRYLMGGELHIANAQDPQIPSALASVVRGVVSLHDFRRKSEIARRTAPDARTADGSRALYTAGSTHYLFPADFAAIYDLSPVYDAAVTGSETSIAIAARSNIKVSDVATFRSIAGLASSNPIVILAGADPGLVANDQDESTLDVEWSGCAGSGGKFGGSGLDDDDRRRGPSRGVHSEPHGGAGSKCELRKLRAGDGCSGACLLQRLVGAGSGTGNERICGFRRRGRGGLLGGRGKHWFCGGGEWIVQLALCHVRGRNGV